MLKSVLASPALLALAAALALSGCAGTSASGPNGWAAGPTARPEGRPDRRPPARRPSARPAPRSAAVPSGLVIPVVGVRAGDLRDSFAAGRSGGRTHNAIDIAAPTGTLIVAPTDGVVSRKHWNRLGGRTLYLRSADGRFDFYLAHLDAYADGVEVGTRVARGEPLGTVGSTGNARGPHLHLQVLDRSGAGRGTPLNPYDLLRGADVAAGR
ncbi:M23 family metallopeptidase [Rubrivirga sp. S365]|uniref:M23 family metallopeptidase n=1 Tax=Rubrivirga litoralis TaxID=3075598 RepID=A0ABU3BQB7_9BACT|nr:MULTISPECIES: M23 family metallopeptidase [unclassified Rubrivirga]MDT0631486.1 M23 family metallopeptidase [Rubrivirga sp. F394]MDT7855531.1 M23 family metallopeptidase [Rubrivirga sp. S365]